MLLLRSATLPCALELTGAEDAAGAEDAGQALWPRGHASALLGPRPPRPRCRERLRHLRVSSSAPVGTGLLTRPSVSCDSTGTGNRWGWSGSRCRGSDPGPGHATRVPNGGTEVFNPFLHLAGPGSLFSVIILGISNLRIHKVLHKFIIYSFALSLTW